MVMEREEVMGRGAYPLFAVVPDIDPINTILPPFPFGGNIHFATAWAVINTPVTLISNNRFASSALYSMAGISC